MYKLLCLAALFAVALSGEVKFKDCGHNEVTHLDISDCSGDYCVIHKGKNLELKADFVANQDSQKLEIKIIAKVNGVQVQVPGIDTNGCNHVTCPIAKGKSYQLDYKLLVPKILPSVKADVTAELVGDHGVVACGTVKGEVQ